MFVKIPSAIFDLQLSGSALKAYCCLLACQNNDHITVIRAGRLAQICNYSRGTARTALAELQNVGLVQIQHQYKNDGNYRSNKYTVANLSGRWFAVPLSALALPGSAFAVYAAFCHFSGRSGKAFPSLNALATLLHLCKNTVISAICHLVQAGLIRKFCRWAGKHNLYMLINQTKKECPALAKPDTQSNNSLDTTSNMTTVTHFVKRVKAVSKAVLHFLFDGVVHFLNNKPLPTQLT